jgi:hypothetical protein
VSVERSPAAEQAGELDELDPALDREPDTAADGPFDDSSPSEPQSGAPDQPVEGEEVEGDAVEPDPPGAELPPSPVDEVEAVPAPAEPVAESPFDVELDPVPEPETIGPPQGDSGLWPVQEHGGATSVSLPFQDWSEVTAAPVLAEPPSAAAVGVAAAVPTGRTRRVIRSRKVRRVIRHIDPWSVLTFSVIFHLCLFGALLLSGSLVWSAAVASGTIDNVESFIRDLGDYDTWEIQGDAVLRAGVIIAGMLTLASSVLVVLLAVVFNLISDLIGGIRVTVVEEEVHRVPVARRG